MSFWFSPRDIGWLTNSRGYATESFDNSGVRFACQKTPDRQFLFLVSGPLYSSVAISVPITSEIIDRTINHPDPQSRNSMNVIYNWDNGEGSLVLNAIEVFRYKLELIEFETFEFTISGTEHIPSSTISEMLQGLGKLLNAIYSFQQFTSYAEIQQSLDSFVNENKFSLIESRSGSFIGIFQGVKKSVVFLKTNLSSVFAAMHGHSKRIAESYTIEKESNAAISQEKVKQEQIKTISEAMSLAEKAFKTMQITGQTISPEQQQELIARYVLIPIQSIEKELMDNNLRLSINQTDKGIG